MEQFYSLATFFSSSLDALGDWLYSKPFADWFTQGFWPDVLWMLDLANDGHINWNTGLHALMSFNVAQILLGGGLITLLVIKLIHFILDAIPVI